MHTAVASGFLSATHSALQKLPRNAGPFQRALSPGTPAQQRQGDQRAGQGVPADGSRPRHLHRTHGTGAQTGCFRSHASGPGSEIPRPL